jgi:hypothetical protein
VEDLRSWFYETSAVFMITNFQKEYQTLKKAQGKFAGYTHWMGIAGDRRGDGAGNEIRTRDFNLGKVALYH